MIKALADHTDVPVPKPYALCCDDSVIGTIFYIMQFLPGRILADPKMPGIAPADRGSIFDSMNDVLARIHNVDYRAVGLGDYGREGQYIQRQLARWSSQYDLARTEHIESMEALKQWLPANIPPGDETRINHGDYRLGNAIVHPTEPRIIAVLDWELSTLGHPLADLGYNCMMYHFGEGFGASGGYAGLDLKAFGIPARPSISQPMPGAPAAPRSRRGTSTSPSRCSGSPPSCRASTSAASTATPRRKPPPSTATAPRRWPISPGRSSKSVRDLAGPRAYSSVMGTIEASLPTGQPAVSITALAGSR